MNRSLALIAITALAACTPQGSGPEAAVTAIYKPLADSKGEQGTRLADIPMTADLRNAVETAEKAFGPDEPVFDFDVAGNCQDCTGFTGLKVALSDNTSTVDGHKIVEATFNLFGEEGHIVYWDMTEVNGAWLVDNVITEGFNLRNVASSITASATAPGPTAEAGVQCMTWLRLQSDALKKIEPPVNTTAVDNAFDAYRKDAEIAYGAEELEKSLTANLALFDDTPPDQIAAEAEACIAEAPEQ